jgi:UDP-N-acetylglucosamine acyltransferase
MANIHATAIVDPKAELAADVEVGPYAVIGPNVKIGEGTVVQSHAYLAGHLTLGKRCQIFPFACLGTKSQDLKYVEGDITYAEIGDDTVMREFSTVHLGTKPGEVTRVGSNCLIMAYCHVAHGCSVGNHVIMSNVATLAGEVQVADYAIIGGLTAVHQFCRIGTHAMVGGGCAVRQDCPPYMIAEGKNFGHEIRAPNIVGLQRRGFSQEARSSIKEAYRIIYREGLNRSQALERIKLEMDQTPEIEALLDFYGSSSRGVY